MYQSKIYFQKFDSPHPPFPSSGFNDCHLPSYKLIVKKKTDIYVKPYGREFAYWPWFATMVK